MDMKISKLISDSKWKVGQAAFVMQLKIKYFVNDISLLRFMIEHDFKKYLTLFFFSRHFLTQHFFYLQFRQMILADSFPITNEQKLSFAALAYQAEYGGSVESEELPNDFIIEYYASHDLINEVCT